MTPEQQKKKGGTRLVRTEKPARTPAGGKKKKEKAARTPKQQALRILFIVVIVLAALIVAVGGAYLLLVRPPDMSKPIDRPSVSDGGNVDSNQPGVEDGDDDRELSDRKEDFYTFLLVGRDTYGGGNTDTMMLASYDVANQHLNVMSLPRDTLVNVSWDIKKLNSVYNMYGGGDKGMTALKEEVGELVGFQPDFTVTVEWEAVGKLVDAIGGVYFDVPRRMYYNDLSQNFKIDLKKGPQTLNGSQAMQLLRYRHDSDDSGHILNSGYVDGDLGRIKVQQDFLKTTISQCLEKIGDASTITKLAKIFMENVTTDLNLGNLIWLGQSAILGSNGNGRLGMENVSFITMPWVSANGVRSRTYNNYPSYVAPDVDEIVQVVNESFNPYTTDLRQDELDIMYVNKDGTLATTGGVLADTKYNAWIKGYSGSSGSSSSASPSPSPSTEPTTPEVPDVSQSPDVSPSPSPSGSASPSPSTSPSASPSTSPSPSEDPSVSPSASPSPSPSQTDSGTDGPPAGIPMD
ncbi:Cell envelope-like function transcriptional attenuator common domain protein [uncultured Eubacteriales bacterium]|uniref:Cell envelope-like function transcriptional attenuator common domain protein n=1 Tax=uncultured Eubacteriales bacterium TaxID=172733 RepID=A0A212K4P1_9FIRM|nr:Cell envelope-like function transcriptional attenuator common domain protein [uncultured Eubacteriales bacterium]